MVGSIVVVSVLTCALLCSIYDMKAIKMNMQQSFIRKLMLHKFKLSYNTKEATKNIYCEKDKVAVDHNTVTR